MRVECGIVIMTNPVHDSTVFNENGERKTIIKITAMESCFLCCASIYKTP